jgi:hypothetical protein
MEGSCANLPETGAGATDSSVEQSPEVEPAWSTWQHVTRAAGGQMRGVREPWGARDIRTSTTTPETELRLRGRPSMIGRRKAPARRAASGGNGREAASAGGPSETRRPLTPSAGLRRASASARPWKARRNDRRASTAAMRVRLPTRIKPSKGSNAARNQVDPSPSGTDRPAARRGCFGSRRLAVVKRSEPHVRYRDATSPGPAVRRKPSRWCKTTRTEREPWSGSHGPMRRLRTPREWTAAGCRRRGLRRIESEEDRILLCSRGASSGAP